ncbi:Major facilitator superfamily domain general substrate transporter [Penicillium cf. griseofulvum]|uniref:Major facilitator superfamily domain general substrate transporter n=1 Tax=Penicillium cf. griseofulvum TaxID=2972120 RepID=A0A9W9MZ14_9EURO|nr:Major facilitator superfamily domain general substrate transporter [Penicillium cf. griseofulvum]KAJ5421320.1 Major facilitator superfamily domain general substrate transporter [Penicillium cf. griseofulvum]
MADPDFPFYRPGRTFYDDDMSRASSYVKRKGKVDNEKFALGRRGILVFFTLSVLTLMAALDGTSLSVALPEIAKELNGTAIEAFWSGTSFLLCSTVFQPSFASFSNIFGRRPMIMIALLFFCVGAVISAIANNFTYMLIGRSIQGVGGGGIISLSEVIITDLVPLRWRGQYFGILSAMWSVGSVTGPILGGGFSENVSWRWIFHINFPFIGVGGILVILFLNLKLAPSSLMEKLRRIDYFGTVLFVGSMSSFLIPLSWGGISYDWNSWQTLAPLCIGGVGLIIFGFYEYYFASDPIVPPVIFQNRTAIASFIGSVLQGLILWCALYYLPLYYEAVKEYSPIISGVALFPETFTVAPSGMVAGILITVTGRYRWAIWIGWAFSTVGLGLMCLIKVNTSMLGWIFLNIVPGLGLGILFPSLGYAVQASTDPENLAIAVAMFSFFRALGQAIGVAVGGVVFQNRMFTNISRYPTLAPMAEAYSKDAAGLVQVIRAMADGADRANLKEAYTDSLRTVWIVCCGVSGVAMLVSLLTEHYDLDRALETDQGLCDDYDDESIDSLKDLEIRKDRRINEEPRPWAW